MEIEEIIKDCIDKVDNIKTEEEKQKQDAINELLKLRNKTIKLIDSTNRLLLKRQRQLQEVNKGICQLQGHTFTDWEEHEGFVERSWYYTRKCTICGKKERSEYEPEGFRKQLKK